jgi:hypothetical protein
MWMNTRTCLHDWTNVFSLQVPQGDVRKNLLQEPFKIEGSSMPALLGVGLGVKLNP